ncbi:hypothetical protein ACIA74_42650, partial [Streptomyces sp. NPDC051658]
GSRMPGADSQRIKNSVRSSVRGYARSHVRRQRLAYPYVLALLARHGSPARLKKLGRTRCEALLKAHGSRKAHHLTTEIYDALAEQTLVVPGTEASALIVPGLAAQLAAAPPSPGHPRQPGSDRLRQPARVPDVRLQPRSRSVPPLGHR